MPGLRNVLSWIALWAAAAGLILFLIAVVVSMAAWGWFKWDHPQDPPLPMASSAGGGDTFIYNGAAAMPDPPASPDRDTRVEIRTIERIVERCSTPPATQVCPPVEPSKLCRCSAPR